MDDIIDKNEDKEISNISNEDSHIDKKIKQICLLTKIVILLLIIMSLFSYYQKQDKVRLEREILEIQLGKEEQNLKLLKYEVAKKEKASTIEEELQDALSEFGIEYLK